MSESVPVNTPVESPTVRKEVGVKEDAGKYTIFKSSYWYGKKLCQLFVNFGYGGHKSFSIVVKQGNYSNIHNLTPEENVSFVKNLLSKLSPEERQKVLE